MKKFFNNPWEFSFKDVIAIVFTATFLFVTYKALTSKDALEVMKTLIAPIMTVLGGYFGQEVATAYFQSKYPNTYNGYYTGYTNYTQPTYTQTTQEETTQQNSTNTPSI
ncbi:hypothetical protein Q2T46_11805 [Thermoanaerobacterium sp. CMT5567-10]|uniref:hypothetical protein n=1 Tax=Thermoanaerobacterium sp. CMT5567-10 TaxID=3061989 RepID=UPI0026DF2797|nr:hypothetical protein [Thermoanaerobacterium sp. CMT5567-10]WKV08212.1 hypothetical protein Q2T46_11805 [Thermoanaerobacterium sp. CMT5567-10]